MPLVRGQNTVFETVKGIHFLMRDPNTREFIACLITHQALIDSGATHEPRLAPMQVLDVHRRCRAVSGSVGSSITNKPAPALIILQFVW